ncbi:hypothetical protein GC425_03210 [Corynebacterium sp. zg254]|uniref:Uncharacterized protein n=1 Tax=Corynebacterium zhongnanshanii TaxID=2768834 RepID=A0ABQ6VFC5_9CORY|nr:hypothetical protein F8377_02410 [Corynebacterium zhongnanshanii]MCR5913877.1 hypothetical protein [Corynebacterium sp. zg254]
MREGPRPRQVRLIGVEPAGEGLDTDKHGAPLNRGVVGMLPASSPADLVRDIYPSRKKIAHRVGTDTMVETTAVSLARIVPTW